MKHPVLSSIYALEGIQTANKNIYSYFMKSEHSYYVPPEHRYSAYRQEGDVTYLVVVSEYCPAGSDYRYKHNEAGVALTCLLGRSQENLQRRVIDLSRLRTAIEEVERVLPGTDKVVPEQTFIGLVYPDELGRVSLMNMIDTILTHGRFKGVLVLPMGLGVSFGLGLSNSLVVSELEQTIVGVEDNCVVSSVCLRQLPSSRNLYGEDPVEEYLKREEVPKTEIVENLCYLCQETFELAEFGTHFRSKHGIDVHANPREGDALLQKCPGQYGQTSAGAEAEPVSEPPQELWGAVREYLQRLAPPERCKKIGAALIYVTESRTPLEGEAAELALPVEAEGAGLEPTAEQRAAESFIEEYHREAQVIHLTAAEREGLAWKGMHALTSIEPSKDLWLTDKEWQSVGLRVLKEKVLFPL